jgi:hypothetical protein
MRDNCARRPVTSETTDTNGHADIVRPSPILDEAGRLYGAGFWVIPIRARGEPRPTPNPDKSPGAPRWISAPATGKEPFRKDWGKRRWRIEAVVRDIKAIPGRGCGITFGPGRGPNGEWLMDLEIDGPRGEQSLLTLMGGEIVTTMSWDSRRGGHFIFVGDGARLVDALVKAGAKVKQSQPGVFHIEALPDLEFRIGGPGKDGKDKQVQSVAPPSIGEDGKARTWLHEGPPVELPAHAYTFVEGLATARYGAKALEREEAKVATATAGTRHDTLRDTCMRLASLYKAGKITERDALDQLHAAARANGLADEGRAGEVDELWASALPLVGPRTIPGPTPSANGPPPPVNGQPPPAEPPIATAKGDDYPIFTPNGIQVPCVHNTMLWLDGHAIRPKFDRFDQQIRLDGALLTEEMLIELRCHIESDLRTRWNSESVRDAISLVASRNSYSSLADWLDGLEWDEVSRIDRFFSDTFGIKATPYSMWCGKVFFISAVARAYVPGCKVDTMIVLIGPQGILKSSTLRALVPEERLFTDDLGADLFEKKPGEGLRGKWIVEFSEFARINRATNDVVKSFLTRQVDHYRPPYGRIALDYPRTCIFAGTTNNDQCLQDEENRRYLPLVCRKPDNPVQYASTNRDQLWAEAVHRYRAGESWWDAVPEVRKVVKARQEAARQQDCWEAILAGKLGDEKSIRLEQVATLLDIEHGRLDKSTQIRIGLTLRKIGFVRRRTRIGKTLYYVWNRK